MQFINVSYKIFEKWYFICMYLYRETDT